MRKISRRDALFVLGAPACAAAPQIAGRAAAGGELPPGVKAVWDLAKAYRESMATRERLSINGLWRWQPAGREGDAAPDGGWGYLRVPESWPDGAQGPGDTTLFFRHPDWAKKDLAGVTAAWQQREVTVPGEWSGRRIKLSTAYLNSYAAVYVDGKKAGEMRYPAGEIDLTALCRTGRKHTISIFVMALPLKGVMLSYNNTASAMQVAAGGDGGGERRAGQGGRRERRIFTTGAVAIRLLRREDERQAHLPAGGMPLGALVGEHGGGARDAARGALRGPGRRGREALAGRALPGRAGRVGRPVPLLPLVAGPEPGGDSAQIVG